MENRLAFKDLVLFLLLAVLIVIVLLAMKQYDRQWQDIQIVKEDLRQLTSEQAQTRNQVHALEALIEQGATVGKGPAAQIPAAPDSFQRLREAQTREDWAQGDWLIDAFGVKVAIITALVQKDAYGANIQNYVLESLVTRDPSTLEWLPHIASDWEIEDHSDNWLAYVETATARFTTQANSDPSVYANQLLKRLDDAAIDDPVPAPGSEAYEAIETAAREAWIKTTLAADPEQPPAMIITFHLRKGVVFSDGEPLTAHDVVFTWELLNNPKIDAEATRNFYDNIATYEALDDYTVRFTMKRPHYLGFSMVAGRPILPRHFYQRYTPEQINRTPGLLLGSGPYRLKDPANWTPGKLLSLVRNERYWGPSHAFARLDWKEITNDVARLTEFRNGDIDRISATPEQFKALTNDPAILERSEPHATDTLPAGYMFMAWNQRRMGKPTLFAQKEVRQAMTFLTERHRICEEVMLGYATVANGPFPPGSPQADPTIEARPFNVDRAKALLIQAGFKDRDRDGVLENAEGTPFRYKLTYPAGKDIYERMVLFLKDSYARAGIVMELDPLEWSVFTERLDSRAFDATILGWGGGAIEADIRQMFHSSQIEGRAHNFMSYVNPKLDDLIDTARMTIEEPKRMALWQACHRILWEDQPYTFMQTRKALSLIDKRIQNVQRVTTGLSSRNEWYVPQPMQLRN